jgi:hypothetical protein
LITRKRWAPIQDKNKKRFEVAFDQITDACNHSTIEKRPSITAVNADVRRQKSVRLRICQLPTGGIHGHDVVIE